MEDHQDNHRKKSLSIGFIGGIIAAILATGSVATWWALNTLTVSNEPTPIPTESPTTQDPAKIEKGQVYWLKDQGDRLGLVASSLTVQKSDENQQVLETAFKNLFAGPTNPDQTTTIPKGTKLLDLSVDKEGVKLNLSQEFTTGGGSTSMTGRLAQILYTATSLDPNTPVWLKIEGEPLEVLGGEGLEIEQPMTRQWFEENFEL